MFETQSNVSFFEEFDQIWKNLESRCDVKKWLFGEGGFSPRFVCSWVYCSPQNSLEFRCLGSVACWDELRKVRFYLLSSVFNQSVPRRLKNWKIKNHFTAYLRWANEFVFLSSFSVRKILGIDCFLTLFVIIFKKESKLILKNLKKYDGGSLQKGKMSQKPGRKCHWY